MRSSRVPRCVCACASDRVCTRATVRARRRAGLCVDGGSGQMYMYVCFDEHVLRGGPEGEFTACEVSCGCARGRQCSAMRGRVKACVYQHSFLSHSRHSISRMKVEAFVNVAAGEAITDADDEGCPD